MLTHAHPFLTRRTQVPLAFLGILLGIGGCTEEVPGPQAAPPTEVTAVTLTPKDIPATYGFVGKTESTRKVEIRARSRGSSTSAATRRGISSRPGRPCF